MGVFLDLKEDREAYWRQVIEDARHHGEPERIIAGVRSVEQAEYFRRNLPDAGQVGLIPSQADIEQFVAAGVKTIRLWPEWLAEKGVVERLHEAGAGLHVSVGRGTREEAVPMLASGPVSLFTDDPGRLIQTLEDLRAGR